MPLPRIECEVVFSADGMKFGEFANSFRVLADSSDEVFLDFCIYSASENVAKVIARVRISRAFLPALDTRIQEAIAEFDTVAASARRSEGPKVKNGLLVAADGSVILIGPRTGEDN